MQAWTGNREWLQALAVLVYIFAIIMATVFVGSWNFSVAMVIWSLLPLSGPMGILVHIRRDPNQAHREIGELANFYGSLRSVVALVALVTIGAIALSIVDPTQFWAFVYVTLAPTALVIPLFWRLFSPDRANSPTPTEARS